MELWDAFNVGDISPEEKIEFDKLRIEVGPQPSKPLPKEEEKERKVKSKKKKNKKASRQDSQEDWAPSLFLPDANKNEAWFTLFFTDTADTLQFVDDFLHLTH